MYALPHAGGKRGTRSRKQVNVPRKLYMYAASIMVKDTPATLNYGGKRKSRNTDTPISMMPQINSSKKKKLEDAIRQDE